MAAAGLEQAAALMAKKTSKYDDAEFDDFLSKVTEVQQQIALLKEGVDPSDVTGVRCLACVFTAFQNFTSVVLNHRSTAGEKPSMSRKAFKQLNKNKTMMTSSLSWVWSRPVA